MASLLDPDTAGPYGFLFALYTPSTALTDASMVDIVFLQSTTDSTSWWAAGVAITAGGLLCISCLCLWTRFIVKRRKRRRQHAQVHNMSNSFSLARDQDFLFSCDPSKMHIEDSSECVICLEALGKKANLAGLQCGHVFHTQCITAWFHRQHFCPMCKAEYSFTKEDPRVVNCPNT